MVLTLHTETQEYIDWEAHSLYVISAVETVSLTEKNQSPIGLMVLVETLDWSGMVKRLWEHSTCSDIALFIQCQSPHHQKNIHCSAKGVKV